MNANDPTRHSGPRRPSRSPLTLVALVALALAGPAAASTRIAIAPVKGDRGGKLGRQLSAALCPGHKCVPGALKGSGNKLKRARKMGVEASVFAAVRRQRGGGQELSVSVFTSGRSPSQTWQLPLGRNGLVARNRLDGLSDDLNALLGVSSSPRVASASRSARTPPPPTYDAPRSAYVPPPRGGYEGQASTATSDPALSAATEQPVSTASEPAPAPTYVADARPTPSTLESRSAPVEDPSSVEVVIPRSRRGSSTSTRPWEESEARSAGADGLPPFLVVDLGFEGGRRSLQFPTDGTAPVGYVVDLAAPRFRLETHPFREGDLAPSFGFFGEGAYLPSLGLSSSAKTFKVSYLSLRGGAFWRYQTEGGLVLRPAIGLEVEQTAVRAVDGSAFPGLPDTTLSGASAGLDVSMPLGASRFTLLADARGIWWLSAKELVGSSHFFPGGRVLGVELEGGAGFRLSSSWSLRALGTYSGTMWWLNPDPSGSYTVRYARSSSFGARGWVRYAF